MQKIIKRFGAIFLAAMMALTLAMPALAAEEETVVGPTTVSNAAVSTETLRFDRDTGSLTMYKYATNGEAVSNHPNDGSEAGADVFKDYQALANVSFDLYTTGVTVKDYLAQGSTASFPADLTQYTPTGEAQRGTTNESGMVKWDNLASNMVYFVKEVESPSVKTPIVPFLVTVPMTTADGAGWIYDIFAYPKNQLEDKPGIDKDVTSEGQNQDTATIGGEVNWIIKPGVPKDIATALKYDVIDVLDSRLEYVGVSAKVSATEIPVTGYTATAVGQKVTISFNEAGRQAIGAAAIADGAVVIDHVSITLTTKVSETADGGDIANGAILDYTNTNGVDYDSYTPGIDPENPEEPVKPGTPENPIDPEVPVISFGGLKLLKVDGDTRAPLSGAHFALYASEEAANAARAPYDDALRTGVSGSDGIVSFDGLKYGEYWIVETKAPDGGYNLLPTPVQVTVGKGTNDAANAVTVENRKGFVLPGTGGVGTTIFTVSGVVLLAGAGILVFQGSKKKNSK